MTSPASSSLTQEAAAKERRAVDCLVGGGFLLGALALLLAAAWRCLTADLRALAVTLQDDSFYYLLPALHLHQHGIWTFDGEHATYGFQPLFAVLLAALGWLFDDRFAFLRAAVWLSHLLTVAAACVLALTVRRLSHPCGAGRAAVCGWIAAALFLFDPPVLSAYTTLKENSLYALVLGLSLLALLAVRERPGRGRLLLLGGLVGLGFLTRIMSSTFAVGIVLLLGSRARCCRGGVRSLLGGLLVATVPWVVYAWLTFGRVLPTSGAVKTGWLRGALSEGTLLAQLSASLQLVPGYCADVLRSALGHPSRFFAPPGQAAAAGGGPVAWMLTALLVALLLLGWHRRHLLRCEPSARLLLVAVLAALLGSATNPLVLDAGTDRTLLYYAQWYIAAEPLLLPAVAVMAFAMLPRPGTAPAMRPWLLGCLAVLVLALGLGAVAATWRLPPFAPRHDSMVHQGIAMIERANARLPAGARLGAANAGVVGFFAERPLVNLDGLANDDVVAARQRGTSLFDYLRQQRIDHLVDMLPPKGGWCGDNPFDRVELVDAVPLEVPGHHGYYLLRVVDERFPDFEPVVDGDGVEVRPWLQPSPVGRAPWSWRSFRLRGDGARLSFYTAGRFAELQATVAAEMVGELSCCGDGVELLVVRPGSGAAPLRLPIQGVQVVEIAVRGGPVWLADVAFATSSLLPAPVLGSGPYGRGYRRHGGTPPVLTGAVVAGEVVFQAAGLPADATATVLVGLRGDSQMVAGRYRVLIELPALAALPMTASGTARVRLPHGLAVEQLHAQLVCQQGGMVVATSQGLRLRLPP